MKQIGKARSGIIAGLVLTGYSVSAMASETVLVSEPGPLGLLGLGAVALLVARRVKRNR